MPRSNSSATLYLLHFDRPYWNEARHYVGYTTIGLDNRIEIHRRGRGSKLVRYALERGCSFDIVHTEDFETAWEARARELRIKRSGHYRRLCPVCQEERRS